MDSAIRLMGKGDADLFNRTCGECGHKGYFVDVAAWTAVGLDSPGQIPAESELQPSAAEAAGAACGPVRVAGV